MPISQTGLDVQRIFSLNQTAAAVWERLEKPCSPQELVADLESAFDAPEGVIEKEVLGLLSEFLEHRFIIVTES